jgi:hypothetical protein
MKFIKVNLLRKTKADFQITNKSEWAHETDMVFIDPDRGDMTILNLDEVAMVQKQEAYTVNTSLAHIRIQDDGRKWLTSDKYPASQARIGRKEDGSLEEELVTKKTFCAITLRSGMRKNLGLNGTDFDQVVYCNEVVFDELSEILFKNV